MPNKLNDLSSEVRILELEVKKLELENRIVELKETAQEMRTTFEMLPDNFWSAVEKNATIQQQSKTIEELKDRNIEDLKELYELYEAELSRFKHVISARDLTINSLTSMCQSGGTERNKLASTIDELKETIRLERIDHTAERSVLNQKYHDDLRSQKATIKHLYNRIDELEHGNDGRVAFLHGEVEGLEAELSARRKDSEVLMKVVEAVRKMTDRDHTRSQLNNLGLITYYGTKIDSEE